MKDYYTILGLDPEVSAETIKIAYRRLALQAHPDRLTHLSPSEQAEASARMAELNEAYTVLSDSKRRASYDQDLARVQSGEPAPAPAPVVAQPAPAAPVAAAPQRARMRPQAEMAGNVIGQFSEKLRRDLLALPGWSWQEVKLEGFDWAARSGSWPSYLVSAFRGFPTLDGAQMRKFLNYADFAVARGKRLLGRDTLVFLIAFQRAAERDIVTQLTARFARQCGDHAALVILDAVHGRSLVSGRKSDPKLQKLLRGLGYR